MRPKVQILLIVLCAFSVLADQESMEERRRRIRRKYLRDRVDITYSVDEISGAEAADEASGVSESEKYSEPQVGIEAHDMHAEALRPVQPLRPALTVHRNWLLDTAETGDPYALPSGEETPTEEEDRTAPDWTADPSRSASPYSDIFLESRFGRQDEVSPYPGSAVQGTSAEPRGIYSSRSPYASGTSPAYPVQEGGTPPVTRVPDRMSPVAPLYSPLPGSELRSPDISPAYPYGSTAQPSTGVYNPYQTSPYRSPYGTSGQERQPSAGTYSPYRAPYGSGQQPTQPGSYTPQQQSEFQRQNDFMQWRQRRQGTVNPLSDDAYIQEMMRRER